MWRRRWTEPQPMGWRGVSWYVIPVALCAAAVGVLVWR